MEISKEIINELKEVYNSNKESLEKLEEYINENGATDCGITDVTESFEQGYNNALEFVFSKLQINLDD